MVTKNEDGTVTLSEDEYNELKHDQDILRALEGAGVDNWEGFDYAMEALDS